ncbi:MAG: PQQ-binding-like beta-propeller repeat protein [Candidatus Bathyarchaeota archaeon]|nr:PQQ-binding-like beta-propeller repeat protein [Candidatus Bathyarchaeota archaeon]
MSIKNKIFSVTILAFILATATILTTTPFVHAETLTTRAYLAVNPNPTGLNQEVLVSAWIQPIPPGSEGFDGLVISYTDPEGQTTVRDAAKSDTLGGTYFAFTPDQLGEYTFHFEFEGDTLSGNDYQPSQVPEDTILVVQQDWVESYQDTPFTGDYWERPINSKNREWWQMSGNWLIEGYKATNNGFDAVGAFNPYTSAPRSPHIMWTKELTTGGLVGGKFGPLGYYPGLSYEPKLSPPLIINGRLYYNDKAGGGFFGATYPGYTCLDLRTGEEIFHIADETITMGQTWYYASGNQMGVVGPYLWNTGFSEWKMFDAFDGTLLATFENASYASVINYADNGEIHAYSVSFWTGQISMWNSTKAFEGAGWISSMQGGEGTFRQTPGVYDWSAGIEWTMDGIGGGFPTVVGIDGDIMVMIENLMDTASGARTIHGIDIKNRVVKYSTDIVLSALSYNYALGEGVFAFNDIQPMTWLGFNATTGDFMWESEPQDYPWGTYNNHLPCMAYGNLYTCNYDGSVTAYNLEDGTIDWKSYSNNSGAETPYGKYPFFYGPLIGGGVVFAGTGEHSPTQPLIRGEKLYAFDAYNGDRLWELEGFMVVTAIADGYLICYNAYDNRMYCIGKGPSATEVTVSSNPIKAGDSTLIQGKITDQTMSLKDTPAISDVDLASWMEYMVMQQPMPMDAVGVPVDIYIIDPEGTEEMIGTTIADMGGTFSMMWTPPTEGVYKVRAMFKGTDAYGSSFATVHIGVEKAVEYPEGPQYGSDEWPAYPETISYTTVDLILIAAVVVAIVIGILNFLALRKRK